MPYPLLRSWYDIVNSKKSTNHTSSSGCSVEPNEENTSSTRNQYHNLSYCDLFESCIPCGAFSLVEDVRIRQDMNESLGKRVLSVMDAYKHTKGRKRLLLDGLKKRFHVFEENIASVQAIKDENKFLRDEILEWRKQYANLEQELEKLCYEMNEELKKKKVEIEQQKECNQELLTYVKELEKLVSEENHLYKRKKVSDVSNKSRTLRSYLSRAQTALWFSKSFGLEVESMVVRETNTNTEHTIKVSKPNEQSSSNCEATQYERLSEKDKEKVEKTLFLMDKFGVGDSFIHELSMSPGSNLPRSYLIKQKRDDLNKLCTIFTTPGRVDGAQVSFIPLLKERVKSFIASNPTFNSDETIRIKISGDGAKMTHSSNFLLLSFSLLQQKDAVMSARGNHTIAVVKGEEKYGTLK